MRTGASRGPAVRRLRLTAGLLAAVAVLAACGSTEDEGPMVTNISGGESRTKDGTVLAGTEISEVINRPPLALPDTNGQIFDLRQRPEDELTAVFFGYTNCPDVCPTAMADLAAARRAMSEADREHVQVVFITEDPKTDTAAVLRQWLDRFDRTFVGLSGGNQVTQQALDALKAPRTEIGASKAAPTPHSHDGGSAGDGHSHTNGEGKTVEHTGSVYAFLGDRVVLYSGGTTGDQYAADFKALLREQGN